jgi:hypothetical protein
MIANFSSFYCPVDQTEYTGNLQQCRGYFLFARDSDVIINDGECLTTSHNGEQDIF